MMDIEWLTVFYFALTWLLTRRPTKRSPKNVSTFHSITQFLPSLFLSGYFWKAGYTVGAGKREGCAWVGIAFSFRTSHCEFLGAPSEIGNRSSVIFPLAPLLFSPVKNPNESHFSCKLWFSASSKEWIIYRQRNNFSELASVQMWWRFWPGRKWIKDVYFGQKLEWEEGVMYT